MVIVSTVNERLRDEAIAHAIWVSRYGAGVANRMLKTLNDTDAELSARLLVALEEMPHEGFTVKRFESLLGSVRVLNRQAVTAMQDRLSDELMEFSRHEAGYQLSLFDALLPDPVLKYYPLQAITPEMVYAAAMAQPLQGRLLNEWVAGAVTIVESQAPGFRSYNINDQENLAVGYRAEGTVNIELLGYSWDATAGGSNPDLTKIGTGENWKKHFTSNKSTAGVLIKLESAPGE